MPISKEQGFKLGHYPFAGDMALMIRASQCGGREAEERADRLIEFYGHLSEAQDASKVAIAAYESLHPQPSQTS